MRRPSTATAPRKLVSHPSIVPADIRAKPAYAKLSPQGRADLEEVVRLSKKRKDGSDFLDKIGVVLDTPHAPKRVAAAKNRAALAGAVETADRADTDRGLEERVSADPERKWTRLGSEPDGVSSSRSKGKHAPPTFEIDRSDPKNIVVRIRVRVSGQLAGKVKKLEDAIEKHVRRDDFTVDLQFVERSGRDVFEVKSDPSQWPTAENWVSNANTLGHELMHLLGLHDEYDYRRHASNTAMTMDQRLYWLKVEAGRKPPPADASRGIMAKSDNPVLARHVREIARLRH